MTSKSPMVRLFLSHKSEHAREAVEVKRSLEALAPSRLRVFVAGTDISPGLDWRNAIRDELRGANLLLLMFTEPTLNWDWCLYEVGLYTQLKNDDVKPVICLHKGEMIPAPIKHLQALEVKQANMEALVESLVKETDLYVDGATGYGDPAPTEPLRSDIDHRTVEEAARSIVTQFEERLVAYHPCHRIVLDQPADGPLIDEEGLLSDAALVRPGNIARTLTSIFDIEVVRPGLTWGDLVDALGPDRPAQWERELGERLGLAIKGRGFEPIVETFWGAKSGIYCPEIYKVEFRGSDPVSVTLVFDSLATPTDVGGELFKLLKADVRFRHEVFDHFNDLAADVAHAGADHDQVFENLRNRIELIYKEAEGNHIFEPNRIRDAYGDEVAAEIETLGTQWDEKRDRLGALLDAQNMPVDERTTAVAETLGDLSMLNHAFTVMTVERIADVLAGAEPNA